MSWPIRLVSADDGEVPSVGDMWFATYLLDLNEHSRRRFLAPNYLRDWASKRPPLVVRLPCGSDFCIDGPAMRDGNPYGDGWTVTGDAPNVTVSPSINLHCRYHGWIIEGVITADCEGRTFG